MPLHIDIRVNSNRISSIHIARLEGDTNPDSINSYVAVMGQQPLDYNEWVERGAPFNHRYGDGAEACLVRGLRALGVKPDETL